MVRLKLIASEPAVKRATSTGETGRAGGTEQRRAEQNITERETHGTATKGRGRKRAKLAGNIEHSYDG